MKELIIFKDREDLVEKLKNVVIKKADANKEQAFTRLKKLLYSYKKGDKHSIQQIIKLRKKILSATSYIDIEIEEDDHFNLVAEELNLLELISEED